MVAVTSLFLLEHGRLLQRLILALQTFAYAVKVVAGVKTLVFKVFKPQLLLNGSELSLMVLLSIAGLSTQPMFLILELA